MIFFVWSGGNYLVQSDIFGQTDCSLRHGSSSKIELDQRFPQVFIDNRPSDILLAPSSMFVCFTFVRQTSSSGVKRIHHSMS